MQKKDCICQETPHLVLCEGIDAYFFLIWLLDFFKKENKTFNVFKVYDFESTNKLKQNLRIIASMDGFKQIVRSVSIIRDAEKNAGSACQSIQTALGDNGFAVPTEPCCQTLGGSPTYPHIRTGFLLFPDCNASPQAGTLEDLCLRILAKTDAQIVLADADIALEPYKAQLPRLQKNRLHTYFSLTNEFVSLKIGEAAKAQAFRWSTPEIESLKSFLLEMAGS